MIHWLDWLMTPLSGAPVHGISGWVSWHGRLMVFSWGTALPSAILIARYFKVTPKQAWPEELDNKFWWHVHRSLAVISALLCLLALGLVLASTQGRGLRLPTSVHAWIGWLVLVLLAVQLTSAFLRGTKGGPTDPRRSPLGELVDLHGDHYDMTRRRYWFERIHKSAGYAALMLSLIAILTGLSLADAPRWMPIAFGFAWSGFISAFAYWQRRGRCVDTYQAIWGTGLEHPGNSKKITGFGVRRFGNSN